MESISPCTKGNESPKWNSSLLAWFDNLCHRKNRNNRIYLLEPCVSKVFRNLHFSTPRWDECKWFLPPVYVVWREGTVFTGVCLSTGGVPDRVPPRGGSGYPPGVPDWVPPWGGPGTPRGVPDWVPPEGYLDPPGEYLTGYPPGGVVPGRVPPRGGTQNTPPGGVPGQGPPRGGTQLGQHSEYLLHSGRYASCVHAGGLSCFF